MEGSSKPMVLLTAAAAALATTAACFYLPSRPQDTLLYSALPGVGAILFLSFVAFVTFWNMHKLNSALRVLERNCGVCGANLKGSHETCPECGTPVQQDATVATANAQAAEALPETPPAAPESTPPQHPSEAA